MGSLVSNRLFNIRIFKGKSLSSKLKTVIVFCYILSSVSTQYINQSFIFNLINQQYDNLPQQKLAWLQIILRRTMNIYPIKNDYKHFTIPKCDPLNTNLLSSLNNYKIENKEISRRKNRINKNCLKRIFNKHKQIQKVKRIRKAISKQENIKKKKNKQTRSNRKIQQNRKSNKEIRKQSKSNINKKMVLQLNRRKM